MSPAGPRGLGTHHPGSRGGHSGGTSQSLYPKQSSLRAPQKVMAVGVGTETPTPARSGKAQA